MCYICRMQLVIFSLSSALLQLFYLMNMCLSKTTIWSEPFSFSFHLLSDFFIFCTHWKRKNKPSVTLLSKSPKIIIYIASHCCSGDFKQHIVNLNRDQINFHFIHFKYLWNITFAILVGIPRYCWTRSAAVVLSC